RSHPRGNGHAAWLAVLQQNEGFRRATGAIWDELTSPSPSRDARAPQAAGLVRPTTAAFSYTAETTGPGRPRLAQGACCAPWRARDRPTTVPGASAASARPGLRGPGAPVRRSAASRRARRRLLPRRRLRWP